MAELAFDDRKGYILRVVKEPLRTTTAKNRTIFVGRNKTLVCYSLTAPDYLPVLEELVGR
jgi:hypothetical protein